MSDIIRGKTEEERFASINHALSSLARKIPKKIPVVMPYLAHFYTCDRASPNGEFHRLVAPTDLTVVSITTHFDIMHGEGFTLNLLSKTDIAESSTKLIVQSQTQRFDMDWSVNAQSLLIFSFTDPTIVEGISLGLLLKLHIDASERENIVRTQLEEGEEN